MGIINDIAKRDLRGDTRAEIRFEVYFPNNNHVKPVRLLKRGVHQGIPYIIMTSGDYPFIDITVVKGDIGTDRYVDCFIRDDDGSTRIIHVKRIDEFGGYDNWKITYNTCWDYVPGKYERGKVHTLESLTRDTKAYIDQIINKTFKKI